MGSTLELEVFDATRHTRDWPKTEADVEAIAAAYSATQHEAPVTLDHKQDGPAYGWVAGLRREGSKLFATLREYLGSCDRELVEAFRAWAAAHNEALRLLAVLRETWRRRKGGASRAQATLRRAVEAGPERKRQDAALERLPGGSDLGGLLRLVCGAAPTGRKVQVLSQRVEPRLFLGGEESHKEAA